MIFFLKNAFCGLLLASVCYCILRFNLYVLGRDSNYVDFDPLPYAWFFFLLGSMALFVLAWEKTIPPPGIQRLLTQALFLFSLLGAVNLFLFEKLNILVQFGTWGQRGMPDRPDEWVWFPLATLAVLFLLLGAFFYLSLGSFRRKLPERKKAGYRSLKNLGWPKAPLKTWIPKDHLSPFKGRTPRAKEESGVS